MLFLREKEGNVSVAEVSCLFSVGSSASPLCYSTLHKNLCCTFHFFVIYTSVTLNLQLKLLVNSDIRQTFLYVFSFLL